MGRNQKKNKINSDSLIMKKIKHLFPITFVLLALVFVQCNREDDKAIYLDRCYDGIQNGDETGIDCGGSCEPCDEEELFAGTYLQEDQMGRPSTNILFNVKELRDSLNVVEPYMMQALFKDVFKQQIMAMDTSYTTNVLGLDADQLASLFSQDVLWVAETGVTSYDNGTQIMTGRALGEDVMDSNLLWIFGGPDGTRNNEDPKLTSDGVDENDAEFLNEFPYLAPPF